MEFRLVCYLLLLRLLGLLVLVMTLFCVRENVDWQQLVGIK